MKTGHDSYPAFLETKIVAPDNLPAKLEVVRAQGKAVATVNGSFDLLHAGHLFILFEASKAADILVVALNTDSSIKRYKSPHRPFIALKERLALIAALSFVDFVTWFEEEDPRELLRRLRPAVHVNGAEYGPNCVEAGVVAEIGASLVLVPRLPGLATSDVVRKIKNSP